MAQNPGIATPPRAPMRAALAALLMRLVTGRVPFQIRTDDDPGPATPGLPVLRLHRPADFYRRIGADGLLGLGEAYQAGDWDSDDLAGLLTATATAMNSGRLS